MPKFFGERATPRPRSCVIETGSIRTWQRKEQPQERQGRTSTRFHQDSGSSETGIQRLRSAVATRSRPFCNLDNTGAVTDLPQLNARRHGDFQGRGCSESEQFETLMSLLDPWALRDHNAFNPMGSVPIGSPWHEFSDMPKTIQRIDDTLSPTTGLRAEGRRAL